MTFSVLHQSSTDVTSCSNFPTWWHETLSYCFVHFASVVYLLVYNDRVEALHHILVFLMFSSKHCYERQRLELHMVRKEGGKGKNGSEPDQHRQSPDL